ncbi:MAG: methyltransferase domain-containing protein [Candidatus Eremiobacteraeota bacterium]|nr:methyltransferase domain-containing protein [Candidatus Eremiobacteraeota bacterium]
MKKDSETSFNPEEEQKRLQEEYFDEDPDTYASVFYSGIWNQYRQEAAKKVLRKAPRPLKIVDVGCGPIPSLPGLLQQSEEYHCLDISSENLSRIEKYFPKCRALKGDAEKLPFPDNYFSVVILFGLLHHVSRPEKILAEARRVLIPGGVTVSFDPCPYWNESLPAPGERGLSPEEVKSYYSNGWRYKIERWVYIPTMETFIFKPLTKPGLWKKITLWQGTWKILAFLEKILRRIWPGGGTFTFVIALKNDF